MNVTKKVVVLLLCMMMIVAAFAVTTSAAGGAANVSMTVSATEVNVGDTVTVSVSYADMTVSSFGTYIQFDKNLLECKSVVGCDPEDPEWLGLCNKRGATATSSSTPAEANNIGQVGFVYAGTKDTAYWECTVFTATFTAKAAGTVTFTLVEDSEGEDGYKATAETATLTIVDAPSCNHATTSFVPNGNGTHKIVCADEECGATIEGKEAVPCTATDDNDCTTDDKCECGYIVTAAKDEHVAGADDGNCKTAVKCANCDQIAIAAKDEHVAGADDGNCMTAVKCANCDQIAIAAKDAHVAGADDGNCMTAVKCANCDQIAIAAKDAHVAGADDGNCMTAVKCANCDQIAIAAKDAHVAGADDGNCMTAVKCANCDQIAIAAKDAHVAGADDGNCMTAVKCVNCDQIAIAAKDAHVAGADDGNCMTAVKCVNCDQIAIAAKDAHVAGADDGNCMTAVKCVNCEKNAVEAKASHTGGEATCKEQAKCTVCGTSYGELAPDNHKNTYVAADFHSTGNDTHYQWIACNDCDNKQIEKTEVENCSGGTATCVAKAICEKCNTAYGELGDHTYGETVAAQAATCLAGGNVAYKQCAVCELYFAADAAADATAGQETNADFLTKKDSTNHVGKETTSCTNDGATHTVTVTCECGGVVSETKGIAHSYNHQTRDFECECGAKYTGWSQSTDGEGTTWTCYVKNGEVLRGWNEVKGSWYYFSTTSGQPATGMTRVPYPTKEINGVTYRPNAEDKAYWEAHKNDAKDPSKYSDAETAVFYFDVDGKFQQTTGIVNGKHFAVKGCVEWHVGFVEIDGAYYYFAGDTSDKMNGNVMATGKVYATRDYNADKSVGSGMIYMFDDNGKLIENKGIVDGYYYNDDNTLAIGKGLTAYGDGYIYVRSNGQIVKNAKYWLSASKLEAAGITDYKAGMYSFDENGMLVLPEIEPELNGIVEKDGEYYYYVDGVKQAGAGVVEMSDDKGTFYIYVTSDGTLATGKYWPTNLNGLLKSGCYDWDTDGKYYPNAN